MRSIWLQARLDTAPQFCGLEIFNRSPSPSAAWHSKRRAHTASHSAPTPPERGTGQLAASARVASGREQRSLLAAGAGSIGSLCITPPSAGPEAVRRGRGSLERLNLTGGNRKTARVPVSIKLIRPQNYGAVVKTLLATRSSEDDPRVLRFFNGFCL